MKRAFTMRLATPGDAKTVCAIYNRFVTDCTSTWQTIPETVSSRRAKLASRGPRHPCFVALDESERVIGFGALSPYSDRGGFSECAEVSVYIAEEAQGAGLGSRFMTLLIDEAKKSGLHVLVSRISGDRRASVALHKKHGFSVSGVIPEMGLKLGRRLDLVIMHRLV